MKGKGALERRAGQARAQVLERDLVDRRLPVAGGDHPAEMAEQLADHVDRLELAAVAVEQDRLAGEHVAEHVEVAPDIVDLLRQPLVERVRRERRRRGRRLEQALGQRVGGGLGTRLRDQPVDPLLMLRAAAAARRLDLQEWLHPSPPMDQDYAADRKRRANDDLRRQRMPRERAQPPRVEPRRAAKRGEVMRILLASIAILAGLCLALAGLYVGLVWFVGYDGTWSSELLWVAVPALLGLLIVTFGIRALRLPAHRRLPFG